MPLRTPPGMANSLYLSMLRQQQQDMENQQARFDVEEDRRLSSMHKMADLQLRKTSQDREHNRAMEQLALQKMASFQQAQMEQGAKTGREQMKQGAQFGLEQFKQGSQDARTAANLGLGYAQLDSRNRRNAEMDPFRKALMSAKAKMAGSAAGSFDQQKMVQQILRGAASTKQGQLLKLMGKKGYELSPSDRQDIKRLEQEINSLSSIAADAMRTNNIDYSRLESLLGGTQPTGVQNPVGINSATQVPGAGFSLQDLSIEGMEQDG